MENHSPGPGRVLRRLPFGTPTALQTRGFLWLIVLVSGLLCALFIRAGHAWGDDFALYIEQAQAILDGSLESLYAANRFAMDHSPKLIGPYLYPNGFPLLLAPVVGLAEFDFVAMKAFCTLFFLLSLPLVFQLVRDRSADLFPAFFVTILVAVHVDFVEHADNVLSDFPFLFFSLASLLFMTRASSARDQVLLGFLMFYAYFTRDLGICLIPALIAYQVSHPERDERKRRRVLPYLVFVALTGLSLLLLPPGGTNHVGVLLEVTPTTIVRNVGHYAFLIGTIFTLAWIPVVSTVAGMAPIFAGAVLAGRKNLTFLVYTASYLFVLLLWPAMGLRFLFPVVPLLAFFWLEGATWMLGKLVGGTRARRLLAAYLALFVVVSVGESARRASAGPTNEAYTAEMRAIYSYLEEYTGPETILGFAKPRALRLFTGRNSIYTDPEHFDGSVADYFLVDRSAVGPEYVARHAVVHEFPGYLLLAPDGERAAGQPGAGFRRDSGPPPGGAASIGAR